MPSPNRVQLNLSLDLEIKEKLREYCDVSDLSFAQAITEYVLACQKEDKLIFDGNSNSTSYSTSIALDNYVTKEELEQVKNTSTTAIPDEVLSKKIDDRLSDKLKETNEAIAKLTEKINNLPQNKEVVEALKK